MRPLWLGLALLLAALPARAEKAIFAGGCFWCMTPPFEKLAGVKDVLSGYIDGKGENPTYQDYGGRGFVEAVEVDYDPAKISYERLLEIFWRQIDPTDAGGQFVDRGAEYRSVVYYLSPEQKKLAERSKEEMAKSKRFDAPIVTELRPAKTFYKAEEYHQAYHKKNPVRYNYYRYRSGRDEFLRKAWAK